MGGPFSPGLDTGSSPEIDIQYFATGNWIDTLTIGGTAAADQVELSGSGPSGWKVEFDPKTVDRIAPNENKEVQARITPTVKAIAGDYVTTLRANARGESASATFRVTVATSTQWGIIGVGIIGAALLVLVGAVARFGRR